MNQQMSHFVQDLKLLIVQQQDHHLDLYTKNRIMIMNIEQEIIFWVQYKNYWDLFICT